MSQESSLIIKIDAQNAQIIVQRLNEELQKIHNQGNRASDSTSNLGRTFLGVNNHTQKLNTSLGNTNRSIEQQSQQVERNSKSLQQMTKSNLDAEKSADGLSNAYQKLAGYMTGIITVGSAISRADGWVQMAAQIENAAGSAEKYDMLQKHLLETANTTYRPLKEAQQVYLDVGTALEATGESTERALRVTDSLSFSYTHNATAADKAASATEAFKKTIYSKKVSSDNWMSILSAIPSIVDDLNRSTGIAKDKILQMGKAGEISSKQLNDALDSNREHSELLANNMSNSLTDGLTVLANAVDTYLGNLNKSSGATNTLAGQLGVLAENIDLVAKAATVVGISFLTKTIIAQTVAVRDSIFASIERRASAIAELQSQAQLAAMEVQRTRTVAALALTEVNLARAEYNSAITRGARSVATIRLTQAEIAHNIATHQSTIAINANATAQNALNAAKSRGALLLGALGGWTGVATISVMALAAAYMAFKGSVEEITPVLDKQGKSVKELTEEYIKLDEAKQRQATRDQVNEVEELTKTYDKQVIAMAGLGRVVMNNTDLTIKDREAAKLLYEQFIKGEIGAEQFSTSLNRLSSINKDLKERIDKQASATIESNKAMELAVKIRDAFLGQSNDFVQANKDETKSIDDKRIAQEKLNTEQQKAYDKVKTLLERDEYIKTNRKARGISQAQAEYEADFRAESGMGFKGDRMPLSLINMRDAGWKLKQDAEARTKAEQETLKAQQEQTRELKKQENSSKRLVGLVGSTGRSTGNHLHVQYPKGSNKGGVTAAHLARFQLGGQTIKPSMSNSHYGKVRSDGKKHGGWDFAAPAGTAVTTSVAVKDVTKYQSENGGYTSRVTFDDGVVIELMHQIPSMMSKVKGGASKGSTTSGNDAYKAFIDQQKEDEEAAKNRLQLTLAVADEKTRIEKKLQEDIKEINKAGFSAEDTSKLIAQYEERAANEIAISQYALKTKLDDYAEFQKTEAELLEESFARKKFAASRDLELTKDERDKAVSLLNEQLKQEQAYLELAKEQRLFQMRQQFLTETQAMQERYRLEEAELIKVTDLKEREFQRQMIRLRQEEESRVRLQNAQMNWANVDAQMKGTTGRMQVEQDRFSRLDTSQQLFDAQMGSVDSGEQGALGRIQEQRNQELITEQEFENQKTLILQTALETRQAIYDAHALRQTEVEEAYQKDSINLQLTQAQQLTGSFANMFRGILGESSGAYKTMYAMQQGFAITQAGMNMWSSASSAYNATEGTVWQKMAAAGKAMLDQGTFLAMIQAITPQGFATGGLVRGPGSGTSDSIPAWLSNEEFVVKARAVKSIGVENLNRMNQTGELPQVHRERQQASMIRQAEVKITIVNNTSQPVEAAHDWKGEELQVILTEMKKQNEAMMDAKIAKNNIMSKRQGW